MFIIILLYRRLINLTSFDHTTFNYDVKFKLLFYIMIIKDVMAETSVFGTLAKTALHAIPTRNIHKT
jgi:hypothetical protein